MRVKPMLFMDFEQRIASVEVAAGCYITRPLMNGNAELWRVIDFNAKGMQVERVKFMTWAMAEHLGLTDFCHAQTGSEEHEVGLQELMLISKKYGMTMRVEDFI